MKSFKKFLFFPAVFALLAVLAPRPLRADTSWRSPLTLGEPTEIPGQVLPAGKYMVKVLDPQQPRKVVQFLSEDETKVVATVLAVPNYRVTPTPEGQFIFFQRGEGMGQALKAWFYPANNFGVEFVYPKVDAVKLAQARKQEVYAAETAKPERKEDVVAVTPELKEVPWKEAPPPKQPETVAAAAAPPPPAPAPAPAERKLPRTGSDLPAAGLAGLAAIGVAVGLRVIASRRG